MYASLPGLDAAAASALMSASRILSSRRRKPPTMPPIAAPAAAPLPALPVIAPPTAPSAAPRAAPCSTGGGDDDGRWLADWEFALCGLLGSNPVCCTAQEWHSYRSLSCCAWFCPLPGYMNISVCALTIGALKTRKIERQKGRPISSRSFKKSFISFLLLTWREPHTPTTSETTTR